MRSDNLGLSLNAKVMGVYLPVFITIVFNLGIWNVATT